MKQECPGCKEEKNNVKLRVISKTRPPDQPFIKKQHVLLPKAMCEDCYRGVGSGEIETVEKS